jgi:hypothetical protein
VPTIDILEEQNLPARGGLLPGCSRQSAATHMLSVVDTTVCSVRYTVFTAKMATNQEHGEAHAKLLAREKAAAEAAEAAEAPT